MPNKHKSAVIIQDFAGLFIALAAIAMTTTLLFDFSTKQDEADERMHHSRALFTASQHLLVDCERANIALRDYLATGEPKYRSLYQTLRQALLDEVASLSATTNTPSTKDSIDHELVPALKDFLSVCDRMAENSPPDQKKQPNNWAAAILAAPPRFSANSRLEAGAPQFQAGAPVLQAGSPVFQAGAPVLQAGSPVFQAGAPAFQSGFPVSQTANSRLDTGSFMTRTVLRNSILNRGEDHTSINTFARLSSVSGANNSVPINQIASELTIQDTFARLLNAIEEVRAKQRQILTAREEKMSALSARIDEIRVLILLVAFIAILFSCFTLHTVMKKDRQKIASLQEAFERTQAAQKEAADALDEARRSNELKSHFMANISHEIRTPMTGILGMADLLSAGDLEPPNSSYARIMLKSAQDLLSVLDDLLNFSKLERKQYVVEKKPFAIRQTIKDVMTKAQAAARENDIALTSQVDENVPQILIGDEDKIRSVLSALVSNGVKFTPNGGVQIAVQSTSDNLIRVAVIDTGIGIKEEDHKRIFQPFFQVDGGIQRKYGGTGLNLTIAKQTVALMEGDIGVMSEPGLGSIFWFTFTGEPSNGSH